MEYHDNTSDEEEVNLDLQLEGDSSAISHHVRCERRPVYNWVDVTHEFDEAASELKLGELLHDKMFGLFEAMSAIEMMDPKMDAGMMCNRGHKKVLSFDQAVDEGKLKLNNLTASEQIGIIDATLACIVTWLEGHSLAQTVFTNMYLHKPAVVQDKVIKSFVIVILKMIDMIRDFVVKACVFEEEDFQPVVYGFKLATEISEVKATGMMKEIEDDFQRKVKNTRQKPGEEWTSKTELMHNEASALYSRLRFCRLFYQSLLLFAKKECCGVEDAHKYLQMCLELIPIIIKTIDNGIFPAETSDNLNKADYPTIMGFEPLINQRLLPPTFPRYTKISSRPESYTYFKGVMDRLQAASDILNCVNFHSALDFFIEFSKISPCVLSRSVLQLLYLPHTNKVFGKYQITDVLCDTIRSFISPPVLASRSVVTSCYTVVKSKEYFDEFLNYCIRPLCSLIQLCGHNRARQRDKLAHVLEDLVALQDKADKVDEFMHNISANTQQLRQHLACFSTWIVYHTLRVMISFVLSGFELELYSRHEYEYIFWYLHEYLYMWIISALTTANRVLMVQESQLEYQQQQKNRSAKKNKKKKKMPPHAKEICLYQAQQNLCAGYYKAIVAFTLGGKLKRPDFPFDSEQVRYEHRFQPFSCIITPPPVRYYQYKEMTGFNNRYDHRTDGKDFFLAASKCFDQAKNLFDSIQNANQEIQTMAKIAKTNLVVMKLILGGHKKDSLEPPEFDFSLHRNFPVIKVL